MSENQTPSIGRIVRYTLDQADVNYITARRAAAEIEANPVAAGMEFPAIIAAVGGNEDTGTYLNLRVVLDGNDFFWAEEPIQGYGAGEWHWPAVS